MDQTVKAWSSTYRVLTGAPLLSIFKLDESLLDQVWEDPAHPLHRSLQLSIRHVWNGIIFQQAYDYQVYLQKMMIDYRLSSSFTEDEDAPGFLIRQDLENYFKTLLTQVETLSEYRYRHYDLVSESQRYMIDKISSVDVHELLRDDAYQSCIAEFETRAQSLKVFFQEYRQLFYDAILSVSDQLLNVPDYHFDIEKAHQAREELYFDKHLGA